MSIHESIKAGIPEALRAKDEVRLRTYRSLAAAMTNEVVAKKRKPDEFLTDEEAMAVLKRAANQRKDSIQQFEAGGRSELAATEQEELAVIEALLPTQMGKEEIEAIARAKMAEMGITDKKDMGRFMGALMQEFKGRADGGDVKAVVDSLFSS
ncbi:MAG TPA: GatB/YqeY domain-containing protein [Candidatus Paceibacterota bacterium]|nr:GatB/YqeY domain-containing protein [Candidatus Paceibacterota bacterium]